jgi:hypothetical protein
MIYETSLQKINEIRNINYYFTFDAYRLLPDKVLSFIHAKIKELNLQPPIVKNAQTQERVDSVINNYQVSLTIASDARLNQLQNLLLFNQNNPMSDQFQQLFDQEVNAEITKKNPFSDIDVKCCSADLLLDLISGYLKKISNFDHETLDFFWNNLADPLYRLSDRKDRFKLAYFFKQAYIKVSLRDKGENDTASAVASLDKLFNKKTMLALNTGRWGLYIGRSSIDKKLSTLLEYRNNANRTPENLKKLLNEFKQLSTDRCNDAGSTTYINKAFSLSV